MRRAIAVFLLGLGCSRTSTSNEPGSIDAASPQVSARAPPRAAGEFAAPCVDGPDCASVVCFHKRLKTPGIGKEERDGSDPLERDGYCSKSCDSDQDCQAPPTSGRCGARGMCKRPES